MKYGILEEKQSRSLSVCTRMCGKDERWKAIRTGGV